MNWVVMPVRNALYYTREAVPTMLAQDIGDVRMFVVNNSSTDGTVQYLASLHPDVQFVSYAPGKSVAYSWNRGLEFVFSTGAPYALVVNNDVKLRPDTMRRLVADGGGFVTAVGVDDEAMLAGEPSNGRRPHPDFSCFLIRREVWERVGPFNEAYEGGYGEDAEYHLRMHRAGINAYCLDIPFLHYACGTLKLASEEERRAIEDRAGRNRARFRETCGVEIGTPEYYALFQREEPRVP